MLTIDDEILIALADEHKQARIYMNNVRFATVLVALLGFGYAFWRLTPKLKTRIILRVFLSGCSLPPR